MTTFPHTPAVVAFLELARAGADYIPAEHLTPKERYAVAEALGWPMDARTRAWCDPRPQVNAPRGPRAVAGFDYEGAILDEQDERFQE